MNCRIPGFFRIAGVFLMAAGWLSAQVDSRADQIQRARREKAAEAAPEVAPEGEQRLNWIQDNHVLERFATGYHGLTLVLGGLGTGQGFALGPQYLKDQLLDGNLVFRTSARASSSRAYLIDMQATLPRLANERVFLDFYARHRNYPRTDYFGPGPDSKESDRAHFLLEDTSADFTLGARLFRNMSVGVTGGAARRQYGPRQQRRYRECAGYFYTAYDAGPGQLV
ncbi:MAG: hypothetical protein O2968_23850 [Acidobacteria bacterium]|nr:hypothetical protein [Acidobacteriota bacterium]